MGKLVVRAVNVAELKVGDHMVGRKSQLPHPIVALDPCRGGGGRWITYRRGTAGNRTIQRENDYQVLVLVGVRRAEQ